MTSRPLGQSCPMHMDEFVHPKHVGSETVEWEYTCSRAGHPGGGPFAWPYVSEPVDVPGDSLGLGLAIELPKAVKVAAEAAGKSWVEYGLVERAYALANPDDWNLLLARYGHTYYSKEMRKEARRTYTASAYLGFNLGGLARAQTLVHRTGRGTGRWDYNDPISFLAIPPGGEWDDRMTWASSGFALSDYMPEHRPH